MSYGVERSEYDSWKGVVPADWLQPNYNPKISLYAHTYTWCTAIFVRVTDVYEDSYILVLAIEAMTDLFAHYSFLFLDSPFLWASALLIMLYSRYANRWGRSPALHISPFYFCRIQPMLQCSESIPPFSRVSDSLLVIRSPSVFTNLVDSLLSMTFWTTIIRVFSHQHSVKRLARPWCMLLLAGKVPNS